MPTIKGPIVLKAGQDLPKEIKDNIDPPFGLKSESTYKKEKGLKSKKGKRSKKGKGK